MGENGVVAIDVKGHAACARELEETQQGYANYSYIFHLYNIKMDWNVYLGDTHGKASCSISLFLLVVILNKSLM